VFFGPDDTKTPGKAVPDPYFGGAGPAHGPALAAEVGAKCVLVPPAPGITAAAGLLATDMKYEVTRSLLRDLNAADADELAVINDELNALESECRARLRADDVAEDDIDMQRIAECRYHGQGFELRIDMPAAKLDPNNVDTLIEAFHAQHENDYGYRFAGAAVELVTLRVVGRSYCVKLDWPQLPAASGDSDLAPALLYERDTVFDDGQRLVTPRYDRTRLAAGQIIDGPAILIQHDSTTLVPPGWHAAVTEHGNIRITEQTMRASSEPKAQVEEALS
jgi:N-methylhydantoinase A